MLFVVKFWPGNGLKDKADNEAKILNDFSAKASPYFPRYYGSADITVNEVEGKYLLMENLISLPEALKWQPNDRLSTFSKHAIKLTGEEIIGLLITMFNAMMIFLKTHGHFDVKT